MRLKYSTLLAVIVIWSVAGYPFIASLSSLLGGESRPISIFMRTFVFISSLLIVVRANRRSVGRKKWVSVVFLLFWAIYFTRMAADTIFRTVDLGRSVFDYWSFALGACFLPALALFSGRYAPDGRQLLRWTYGLTMLTVLISLLVGNTTMIGSSGERFDTGRLGLDSLNPIFFGHLGATLSLIAYWILREEELQLARRLLFVSATALGVAAVVWSGSRGPLVALLASVLFVEAAKGGRQFFSLMVITLPFLSILTVDLTWLDEVTGMQLFARIQGAIEMTDRSAVGRIEQVSSGWNIFLDSPIFGGALEDPSFRIYPHNVFVEAFMATGLIGGALFCLIVLITLVLAIRLARKDIYYGAFSVLYVQYLVAAQFSGSLYTSTTMWALTGFIGLASSNQTNLRPSRSKGIARM